MLAHKIDANGYMLEPVMVDDSFKNTADTIVDRCPDGFYKPQWNGTAWVDAQPYVPTLADVQKEKIAELKAGLTETLAGGFTSKATGHTYKTDTDGQSNMHADIKRFELDSTLSSLMFYTTSGGWISHSHTDLQNAFLDGGKWKDAQYSQFNTLFAQVNSAQDVATVQAITWTPAVY